MNGFDGAPPPEVDGRLERGRVTREKIISALLDLIRAGNLSPTSEDEANYADVGHRTVFRHFQDMESLFEEINAKVRALAKSTLTQAPCEGSLTERIESLVANQAAPFERITAYYLSGEIRPHSSPTLQRAAPDLGYIQWLSAQEPSDLVISALTFGELKRGVGALAPGRRRTGLEARLAEGLAAFGDRILPIDVSVASPRGRGLGASP